MVETSKVVKRQGYGRGAIILFCLCTLIAGVSCQNAEKETQAVVAEGRRTPVKVIGLKAAEGYEVSRRYNGVLKPRRSTDLSFVRGGMLTEIRFDTGDRVGKGEVVAVLDQASLQSRRQSLNAQLKKAQSRVLELRRGPRVEPKKAAAAEVRRLRESLRLAEIKLRRRQKLFEKGAVPRENLDEFEFEVRILRENLAALEQNSLELQRGTRPEVITQAQADVEQIQASIGSLAVEFRDSSLKAPYAGVVSDRLIDEGTVLSAGTPVLRLFEGQTYEAWIDLPLQEEIPDSVELELGGRSSTAYLIADPPVVDNNSLTRTVRYLLNGGKPGEAVSVSVKSWVEEPGFWIPTDAITASKNGLWTCYMVADDSTVEAQTVEVLYREDDRVLARGAINSQSKVIQDGLDGVVPGQRVQVVP